MQPQAKAAHATRKGFTLIEMAFILILIGVMTATLLPRLVSGIKVDRAKAAKADLTEVRDEIVGITMTDSFHQLPSNTDPPSLDETAPDELKIQQDPWGQDIDYYVALDQDGNPLTDPGVLCDATSTKLQVNLNGVDYDNIAFVVASRGKNGNQDYDAGLPADDPRLITGYSYGAAQGTTNEYDDIVEFVTLQYLQGKACSGATSNDEPTPPGTPTGHLSFDDGGAGYTPGAGASVVDSATAGGGIGDVLHVNDSATGYISVDNPEDYRLHEFTIMGWFKTDNTATDTGNNGYEPIISRGQLNDWTDRNYWVVLWADAAGYTPGEIIFRATDASNAGTGTYYNMDSGSTLVDPSHHDARWHFFALTMENLCLDDAGLAVVCSLQSYEEQATNQHRATLYISEDETGTWATDVISNTTTELDGPLIEDTAAGDYPWPLYIGRATDLPARSFDGYIDEISIYDEVLSESTIKAYFEAAAPYYF